jgi:hypothetical protein
VADFSFVQQKDTQFTAGTGSGNLVLDSAPTNGNVLLMLVASSVGGQGVASLVQTGVTWTKRQDVESSNGAEVWEGVVGSGASATIAITREASSQSCAFACIEAVLATGAAYSSTYSGTSSGTSTTPAGPSVTPAAGSKWLMVTAMRKGGTLSSGPASGWTALTSSNGAASFAYKLSNSGPGTAEQNSYVFSTSTAWTAAHVTLFVAPGAGPASKLALTSASPANDTTSGTLDTMSIQVQDASSVHVTSSTVEITATLNAVSGSGSLTGDAVKNAVGGQIDFDDLGVDAAGTYNITYSSPGLTSVTTADFDIIAGQFDGAAELPRVTPTRVSVSGLTYETTTAVTAANIQSTINTKAALAGSGNHLIVIDDGELITSTITLPARSGGGTGLIVIRSETMPCLEGIQVHPSMITTQAEFRMTGTGTSAAFATAFGENVRGYVLAGLNITKTSSDGNSVVYFGTGDGAQQYSLARVPEYLYMDRCVINASNSQVRRNISLQSGYSVITECWISSKYLGQDNQCIYGGNGPGPYLIEHNYLEAAGENIMFGGGSNAITDLNPSDITIRLNAFAKPPAWDTVDPQDIKNLFELKAGIRTLVEGNFFENNWSGAQSGMAILIKSTDQDGNSPWMGTTDCTFRYNFVRNVGGFVNVHVNPQTPPSDLPCYRVTIRDNVCVNINSGMYDGEGRTLMFTGGEDYQYVHNTTFSKDSVGTNAMAWLYGPLARCQITDNIDARPASYGIRTDSTSAGTATWNAVTTGASSLVRNVIGGQSGATYPTPNYLPASTAAIGFVDSTIQNRFETDTPDQILVAVALSSGSAYKGLGEGGSDPGADIATVRDYMGYAYVPGLRSDTLANYTGPGPNVLSDPVLVATKLAYVTQPSSLDSGDTTLVEVQVLDQFDDPISSTAVITLSKANGAASISGDTSKAATAGVASFNPTLTSGTTGSNTLTASSPGLTSATSSSFTVTAPGPTPVATKLAFTGQPSNLNSGATTPVEVSVLDQFDALFSSTAVITLAKASGTAAISGDTSEAATAGVATLSPTFIDTVTGANTITATSPGLTSATSSSFTVTAVEVPSTGAGTDTVGMIRRMVRRRKKR